jgi:hypothetical protein
MPDAPLFLDFPFPLNWWHRRNQSKAFPSKTADIFLESLDSTPMLLLQGICITSHACQCRTVDQVVVLPDGADAKGWYVSLSRAREAMHVYTRNKLELRQSVMQPGERKSVWELLQALQRSKPQPRDRKMPDLWATRQGEIDRDMQMER